MKFNINHNVKVKLTSYGVDILKMQHDEIQSMCKSDIGEFKLVLDKDGYCSMQLWDLMKTFGDYMIMGRPLPFETEIVIEEEK